MQTAKPKVNRIGKLMSDYLKYSITRVCVLMVTLTGCFCSIYGLITGKELVALSVFVGVIFGSAFGGKFFNKKLENNGGGNGN